MPEAHHFALVDEGPGWSGSSFGAASGLAGGSWRRARPDPLLSQPSRGAAGAGTSKASRPLANGASARGRFRRDRRPLSVPAEHTLATWCADLVGPPEEPLLDLSQGRWRASTTPMKRTGHPASAISSAASSCCARAAAEWLLKFVGSGPRQGLSSSAPAGCTGPASRPKWPGTATDFFWSAGRTVRDRWMPPRTSQSPPRWLATISLSVPRISRPSRRRRLARETLGDGAVQRGAGLGEPWAATLDSWRPKLAGCNPRSGGSRRTTACMPGNGWSRPTGDISRPMRRPCRLVGSGRVPGPGVGRGGGHDGAGSAATMARA